MNTSIYRINITYISDIDRICIQTILGRLGAFNINADIDNKKIVADAYFKDTKIIKCALKEHSYMYTHMNISCDDEKENIRLSNGNILIHGISIGFNKTIKCDIIDSMIKGIPGSPWDKYIYSILYFMKPYINNTTKFIDIGCGRGTICLFAKAYGANEVIGVDKSKKAIEASRIGADLNNITDIEFLEMDIFDYISSENKNSFDTITINQDITMLNNLIPIIHNIMNSNSVALINGVSDNIAEAVYTLVNKNENLSIEDTVFHKDVPIIIVKKG